MKEKLKDTRFRIILILGGILVFFLLVIFLGQIKTEKELPKALLVQPEPGSTEVAVTQQLSIKFDRAVETKNLFVKFTPEVDFGLEATETNTLLIVKPVKGFSYATKYFVAVTSKENNIILAQLSFTTIQPQGSSEPLEVEKVQVEQYPLAPFNPPDTAHFYFQYTGPLAIKAYAVGDLARAKAEFGAWAASLNIDLSKHKIEWAEK